MSDPVSELLQKHVAVFTVSGKDYLIKCLNPEHEDTNPSLRVDKVTGVAHCFACGWKRNLFKHFGVINVQTPIKVAKLKEKLKELTNSTAEVPNIVGATPYTQVFRGISVSTLRKFEALYTLEKDQRMEDRVIFPIKNISGKTVSYIGRHVGHEEPRYKHFPSGVSVPPYPLNFEGYKTVVLVEGIFDMLNLYDKGLTNVVCCFGTDTLKKDCKDKLLPLQAQGIHKLYLMFDGDNPGRDASSKIKPLLEDAGYSVEVINLPDDTDPGDLDADAVKSIKEYVNAN